MVIERTVKIEEFPKHIRKRMRKQFRDNEYCPKCDQITCVVKHKNHFYCSWCNRVFKNGKIIEKKELKEKYKELIIHANELTPCFSLQ